MAKGSVYVLLMFFSLLIATHTSGEIEKLVKIHFYVQETLSGPNATMYEVARADAITPLSQTPFGQVQVVDDLVTAGPARSSEELGRSQGIFASTDMKTAMALSMDFSFVFSAGKYNGSTISVLGWIQYMNPQRELAVVGGTGALRGGRGYAMSSIIGIDNAYPGYVTVEYTIYITTSL